MDAASKVTIIPPAIAGQLAYHAADGTDVACSVAGCTFLKKTSQFADLQIFDLTTSCAQYGTGGERKSTKDASADSVPLAKDFPE